jgi:hypothetical protein
MSLELHKLDLHVHTPASHDFHDKSVTAEAIVAHAQAAGLSAIAVTDHNTVDFVDKMHAAAKAKGFTVFPGIEVSCGGTQSGAIHVIALFDPTNSKDDLQKVLGKLGITGKGEDALTQKSPADVVEIINESGGLAVLAHANSKHGALSDIKGNPRTALVQHEKLSAAEATATDFTKPDGKKLIDVLNGDDPTYRRKLAVYKASDNPVAGGHGHCIEAIGSSFTYFRMGELTLESLRECFEDRDSRIVQDFEADKITSAHPRIESLVVSGGFLDKQSIPFHCGMNSIIGGTGTGKSLTIELLRFVFDRAPTGVLLSDHKEKLQKQLRVHGTVTATFRDASGSPYKLTREYTNQKDPYHSPVVCVNTDTGKSFKGDLSSLVPLLIYSQNEILEITRDGDAQLRLLDNFRDFETYQNQVAEIQQYLQKSDHGLYQAIQDSLNSANLTKQLQNVDAKLEKVAKQISGTDAQKKSKPYMALVAEQAVIEEKIGDYDTLLANVDQAVEDIRADMPAKKTATDVPGKIEARLRQVSVELIDRLKISREAIENAQVTSRADLTAWEKAKNFTSMEKAYKDAIKVQTKDQAFEATRQSLLAEKKDIATRLAKTTKAAAADAKLRTQRSTLLAQLGTTKSEYFAERSQQASLITTKAGGKLRITVHSGDNRAVYLALLRNLIVGSYAEKKEVETIAASVSPVHLVNLVLDKDATALAKAASLSEQKAEAIIGALSHQNVLMETLALQYKGFPEDRITIEYKKKDGQYYPLSELSMGQKADALIMIALGDGTMPVVIDQPEDALDIPSIWADICSRLRISKHVRQFVFTTHNSSISVSSDSDQFIVFEADGKKGWIARSGSIDEKAIKDEVVGHLEGGYSSYALKRKKYGL